MDKTTIWIIIGLLILGGIIYIALKSKSQSFDNEMFIATEGQSRERIKNLNLAEPSEDASHLLDIDKLNPPKVEREQAKEYKANPDREWIIELVQLEDETFKKEDFNEMFDYEWRVNFESTIFGLPEEENLWTYANAGDTPDIYSRLQVAVDVQRVYQDEMNNYQPEKLDRYISELEKRIKKYPSPLKLDIQEPIADAIAKAKSLNELHEEFNYDAIIVLESDSKFSGIEAWDALQSLGLQWGDMDLFHWYENKLNYGTSQLFSVWTSTNPGYFFPEDIKSGQMNPANLIFGFSIPRSADPVNLQKVMIEAVYYCQKRLGGKILNQNGNPFLKEMEMNRMAEIVSRMKAKGLVPGSDNALRMF